MLGAGIKRPLCPGTAVIKIFQADYVTVHSLHSATLAKNLS